jgi:hypothetical protein
MPRRCGQSAPPTSNAPLASGVLQVRVWVWPRCPAPPPQVRPRQVVQSPPWLVATQQAEPAPLPPLSAASLMPAHQSSGAGGCVAVAPARRCGRSAPAVWRCSSSTLAPRLSLVGSLRCLPQRYQFASLFAQPVHRKGWAGAIAQSRSRPGRSWDSMHTPASTESRCVCSPACLWRHSSPAGPEQRGAQDAFCSVVCTGATVAASMPVAA